MDQGLRVALAEDLRAWVRFPAPIQWPTALTPVPGDLIPLLISVGTKHTHGADTHTGKTLTHIK